MPVKCSRKGGSHKKSHKMGHKKSHKKTHKRHHKGGRVANWVVAGGK